MRPTKIDSSEQVQMEIKAEVKGVNFMKVHCLHVCNYHNKTPLFKKFMFFSKKTVLPTYYQLYLYLEYIGACIIKLKLFIVC
jgi:hypothetical protein